MTSSRLLADALEAFLREEGAALRAVPDGPATARPNRPHGGGWSQREELGHLIDSAVVNHQRFVRGSLAASYEGPSYEADAWVAAHGYAAIPWTTLVETWERHNAILVPLVRGIPDARLATPCAVGGDPPVTLGFLVDDYLLHARHHLDQIHRRPRTAVYPRAGSNA